MELCISITLFLGPFLPKQTWEANEECFQAIGLAKNPGRSPFSLLGCAQISEVKVPSNPSLVNEVRGTRSKSQFKGVYAYDMFMHSWFMLIAIWLILCGMLCMCLLGLGSWYLLVLKALQVSITLVLNWDVEQLVFEGGMVPDYVNVFPPMFYRCFHVCIYGIITCFYANAF